MLMRPEVVVALLLFYLVSKYPLQTLRDAMMNSSGVMNPHTSGVIFRTGVAVHNLALAVFSAVCAWNAWRIVAEHT
jgi:hypothetical protein